MKIEASLQIDRLTLASHPGRLLVSYKIHAERNGNAAISSVSPC
jgi:hypothetical protein